jgi:hypothetical protein
MINKNVIFCGVVRNVGDKLRPNIEHVLRTGQHFQQFKIIIYENNSTDNTKDILKAYSTHAHVKILSEDLPAEHFRKENNIIWAYTELTGSDHPCRMELISNARNKLIDEIRKPEYSDYSHCIMMDLDSNGWDIDGIIDSFRRSDEWDAVFANSRPYYDYYALRSEKFPFGPEITGEYCWNTMSSLEVTGEDLVPVYSAFNGIGIYKKALLEQHKYDFVVNKDVKTFYRNYIKIHSVTNLNRIFIENPCIKHPLSCKDEQSEIVWKSNSGYKGFVVCEHVPLNFALYNKGYKLFINPSMLYYR